ncbi:MAG: hypothetical protein GZ093_14915 [Rhodoferax sp.]|uniref:J domain-containing protein n=1 Tax=Rhodoferax sp. TaxID=50421 RepID=UPI0013FE7046|nr:J domain-containing protein [Rhodoferax sp.]NDP40018.1 hypothetical protein [Rhodoferax sp.]
MPRQTPLFSDNEPDERVPATPADKTGAPSNAVTALQFTSASLSPEQQRFNKLITRTENLARKIEATRTLADAHRPHHGATLRPLEDERSALMRRMALWLDVRLQRKGLSAKQKRMTSEMICNLTAGLAMAGDEAMQQMHDAHSDESLAEQEQSAMADMQAMMEGILGHPPGHAPGFESLQDMLQASMRQMQEQQQAQDEARAGHKRGGKSSARQQQSEQQAQDAQGALRTIYRQLVSALHPDRESDTHERARKTALMKEVNAAYERRDLLGLLQLQVRAALTDGEMMSNLAREKVAALSVLLKDRAAVLTRELRDMEMQIRAEFGLAPSAALSAGSLKRAMIEQQQNLQVDVVMMQADLQRVQEDAAFKRWLREQHQGEQDGFDPFELPGYF